MRIWQTSVLLAGLVAFAVPGRAHEGATGIVKERMDAMTSMGKAVKEINRRVENNRNLAGIEPMAREVAATGSKIPGFFPTGSGTGITDAKPIIWQQWDQFQVKAKDLVQAADTLATTASAGDPVATAAQLRSLAKACSNCHETYRAKHDR